MCGIAGNISTINQAVDLNRLKLMTSSLTHRGPDSEGTWLHPKGNVCFGHRRLSILDLSDAGHQPMTMKENGLTITYNGEIYNYIELRNDLKKKGYKFQSNCDTEVLLALYDHMGIKSFSLLDGMFAFALWDEKKQKLICARDRFGEKPFFFHKNSSEFLFASEIKALWAAGISKQMDPHFVYNFLMYGVERDPHQPEKTFYKNIYELKPAHYAEISLDGGMTVTPYWKLSFETTFSGSFKSACEQHAELLTNSIALRLRSDVPVGSSLSGGLDSSSIVCAIDKVKKGNQIQKTFSARFPGFERDEGPFINKALNHASNVDGIDCFPDEDSLISNLDHLISMQDEPFGSFSIAAQYEVMKTAKSNQVTVLLDGQGADEAMAGYINYMDTYYRQLRRENMKIFTKETQAYANLYAAEFKFYDKNAWLHYLAGSLFSFASQLKLHFTPNHHRYFSGIHPDLVRSYKMNQRPRLRFQSLKEHLHFALTRHGLKDLLRYADRNSMAHSVEVRLPFLSHSLVEFCLSLPEEFLISGGWSKYILRNSYANVLPQEIAWRKDKVGYEPPQKKWMKNSQIVERIAQATSRLQDQGLIHQVHPGLGFKYLMLGSFL